MQSDHPFTAIHSPNLMLMTEARRDALARLDEGLGAREPFVLVTGEAGTGKTALAHEAAARWGARATVAFLINPALTRTELIEEIVRRFGAEAPAGASKPQLLARLEGVLGEVVAGGQVPVLAIDDAHDLTADLLEELRLIVNAQVQAGRPLEIMLVGLPSLKVRLDEPAMVQLRQRVSVHCNVPPLSHKQTRRYLHHRMNASGADGAMLFPRETCSEIHARTGGVPREVNTLAAEAMRRARQAGAASVTPDHVRAAAEMPRSDATPSDSAEAGLAEENAAEVIDASEPAFHDAPTPTPIVRDSPPDATEAELPSIPAPELSGEARVEEWLAKFRSADGPPRLGSRAEQDATPQNSRTGHSRSSAVRGRPQSAGRVLTPEPYDDVAPEADSSVSATVSSRAAGRLPRLASRRRRHVVAPVSIAAIVVVTLAAILLLPRASRSIFGRVAPSFAAASHGRSEAGAPARPNAAPQTMTEASLDARSGTATRARASLARVQAPQAESADSSAAKSTQRYTLEVARFFEPERATGERDRVAGATGLQAWMVDAPQNAAGDYPVVLGIYRTRDRAESAASVLLKRGIVSQARVIPLPPRRMRR